VGVRKASGGSGPPKTTSYTQRFSSRKLEEENEGEGEPADPSLHGK